MIGWVPGKPAPDGRAWYRESTDGRFRVSMSILPGGRRWVAWRRAAKGWDILRPACDEAVALAACEREVSDEVA